MADFSFSSGIKSLLTTLFLTSVMVVSLVGNVCGAGFQLYNEMSARTAAMGAAAVARSDIAELAWFNPAGAAMMERPEIVGGLSLIYPGMEFQNDNGRDYEMKDHLFPIPHLYMAAPLGKYFGASLSLNSPYGLTTDWDRDWLGNRRSVLTDLKTIYISPSFSFSPCPHVSFGAGPQFVYGTAELRKYSLYDDTILVPVPGVGNVPATGSMYARMEGDDWGYGYSLSMLIKPVDLIQIGLVYHSEVDLDLHGRAKFDISGEPLFQAAMGSIYKRQDMWLDLTLPATFTIGITTTFLKDIRLSADFLWTEWSSYDSLDFEFESLPTSRNPKKWKDVWSYRFGIEYTYSPVWQFRASYVYDESPIPDDRREPMLPTNDRHIFGFGVGWTRHNLGIDAGYSYVLVEDASPGKISTPELSGQYDGDAHIFNISMRWTF